MIKVFGLPLSPFVRKVHVVAAEKGIAIEMAEANPRDPSPEFLAASPFRKIPAMQDGDFLLADSTAICTYFDTIVPSPAMLPAEAKARARTVWFEEVADTVLVPPGGKIMFNRFVAPKIVGMPGDEAVARQGEAELAPLFDWLETQVPVEGWLTGTDFTIGDIAIASVLTTLAYCAVEPDPQRHAKMAAWLSRVAARPAWQQVAKAEAAIASQFA